MSPGHAWNIAAGHEEGDDNERHDAWQTLVNDDSAWALLDGIRYWERFEQWFQGKRNTRSG